MKIKQKMVRILTGILTMILVLSSITFVSAVDKEEEIDKLIEAQARAVEANEVLMQYFFVEGCGIVYPDYFAGRYIEDNIFHIRLAAPTDEELAGLKNLLSGYEDVVVYEYGDFSRTFLQNYADEIASELKEQGVAVANWGVDDKTGDVNIGVLSEDIHIAKEMIEIAQTYSPRSGSPKIVIEEGGYVSTISHSTSEMSEEENVVFDIEKIDAGRRILVGDDNSIRSVGICGYYNGRMALVTCGHGGTNIGDDVVAYHDPIGTVVDVQYEDGEEGDYSIVELNDRGELIFSHKISTRMEEYGVITGGTVLSPAIGTTIKRYGFKSGYSSGTVIDVGVTVLTDSGRHIHGLTKVSITDGAEAIDGDSGGPVLSGKAFCGIVNSKDTQTPNIIYFTPYSIISASGFTAVAQHDCSNWTNANGSFHSGYCGICDETVYEAHSEYWNHLFGRCTRCGRTGQVPFDP